MTKRRIRYLLVVAILLLWVGRVSARQFLQGDRCAIPAGETISGTLFVLCQDLQIDGVLDGNLIGAATTIVANGDILDSVYLIGGQADFFGRIGGDLHYAGAVLNLHESASFDSDISDVFSLTMSTEIDPNTDVPGSVLGTGYQLLIGGNVGGEVSFWGSALELGGTVGSDLAAVVGDAQDIDGTAQLETLFLPLPVELNLVNPGLRVQEGATVGGLLRYRAPRRSDIPQDVVNGDIFFEELPQQPQIADITNEETIRQEFGRYMTTSVREFATLAVVGALGLLFAPALTQAPIRNLRERPLTSLGVGTLTFILSFPIVVIAVVVSVLIVFTLSLLEAGNLTIAGIVVLVLLDVGGASLFYFVAIFVARSIVCLALGRRLLRFVFEDDGTTRFLYVGLLAGSFTIALFVSLPFIGWLLNALTLFIGLGAIVNLVQVELRNLREGNYYAAGGATPSGVRFGTRRYVDVEPPLLPEETPPAPPPRPPKKQRPRHTVGTDNLPEGFVWWDDM
jgi:cytoskeletal protein CcmA (bactofilin family)